MANSPSSEQKLNCMIGRQVRLARNMEKMSMAQLGGQLGITYQQMQKYEKGTNRISAARLSEVSQILNQPLTFFYDGVIDDLSPHIGYLDLKTAYALKRIPDGKTKQQLIKLIEQMDKDSSVILD